MDPMVLKRLAKKHSSGFVFVKTAAPAAVTAIVNWTICGILHFWIFYCLQNGLGMPLRKNGSSVSQYSLTRVMFSVI